MKLLNRSLFACARKRAIGTMGKVGSIFSHIAQRLFNLIAIFLDSHKNCIYIRR